MKTETITRAVAEPTSGPIIDPEKQSVMKVDLPRTRWRRAPASLTPERRAFALFFVFASCSGSFFARVPDLQLALGASEGAFGVALVGTSVGTLAALTFAGPIVERVKNRSRRDLKPIRIRQSADLSKRLEHDHRAIKRRVRPTLGFQSMVSARVILGGIEMIHMMRKQQAKYACNRQPSLAEQLHLLAA